MEHKQLDDLEILLIGARQEERLRAFSRELAAKPLIAPTEKVWVRQAINRLIQYLNERIDLPDQAK